MNKMTKIALATASVLSVGALSACQSTQAPKDTKQSQYMHGHYQKNRHMTPEQRKSKPCVFAMLSRKAIMSLNFQPVSTCSNGNGSFAG